MDSEVTMQLVGRIAHKLYPQHLERFATTLLGNEEAEYFHITDGAGDDPWKRCFYVLRAWYNQDIRTIRDLCTLLRQAERLGFVPRGTHDDLVNGKVWDEAYMDKCQTGPYPDFASMVAPWYMDPIWQNMLLFPWMDEEALQLSEVYTDMEMEEYRGRDRRRIAIPLNDYKDLFKGVKPDGTRILVKGDPGIGKSTFVQKLAFDWANRNLDLFDIVLVVKLKFAESSQTIESMVKSQIKTLWEDDAISEELVWQYMKSGRDRVLLVLDGLDEINLKQYPQVNEVLTGQAFRKCCILATTRPYVAETLQNKMTSLAKINGFSREQAEKFIGNMLDTTEREKFLRQLDKRKMSQMHKVPLIVQALALLFREYQEELPRTYTNTYDELVLFLRKSCKQSKELNDEELQAAMDEVNELAFKGLTREDKQLIFSRDEVKNKNTYKLGILTAEKAGSGFRPTEVLQFPHKTVQEHSASDHVVKRLLNNDREPWETLVQQFHKDASRNDITQINRKSKVSSTAKQTHSQPDVNSQKNTILKTALQKVLSTALSEPGIVEGAMNFCHSLLEAGAFDDDINYTRVSNVFMNHPIIDKAMNTEEKHVLADFAVKELWMETPKEWRAHEKSWLKVLLQKSKEDENTFKQYLVDQKNALTWILNDPEMAKQSLLQLASFYKIFESGRLETEFPYRQPYQYISQEFSQLLDHNECNKTLFRFIIGKLSNNIAVRDTILLEIAVLVIQHSFDENNGGVLPFNELLSFIGDVKTESLPDDDNSIESDPFLVSPALVHLTSSMSETNLENLEPETPCALKVMGRDANIVDFLTKTTKDLEPLRNIHIVELECIDGHAQHLSQIYQDFVTALYQSPRILSMELSNVDPSLVSALTRTLPSSVQRLSVGTVQAKRTPRGTITLPPQTKLIFLNLENCLSRIDQLFANTRFPDLKKLSMKDNSFGWEGKKTFTWEAKDVQSLLNAVHSGRMPKLEELNIRDSCLRGCGAELVEILKATTLLSVELNGVQLSLDDGHILLRNIQGGHLNHLQFLNLMLNEDLSPLVQQLKAACQQHETEIEINAPPEQSGSDTATTMTTLVSNFFQQYKPSAQSTVSTSQDTMQQGPDNVDVGELLSTFLNAANSPKQEQHQSQETSNPKDDDENRKMKYADDLDLD